MAKCCQKEDRMKAFRISAAPLAGIAVALSVLALLNAQLIGAYAVMVIQPAPQEVSLEPPNPNGRKGTSRPAISKEPLIAMPAAGIKAPVVYGVESTLDADVQRGLERGILHFGDSALPGEAGNAVYVGHSSGQPWAPGDYKFVFSMLYRLNPGDKIQLAYDGELYIYEVTEKVIVEPTDVSVLKQSEAATATFITCWPIGVNAQRMVIKSKLISHEARKRTTNSSQGAQAPAGGLPGSAYSATEALQQRLR